MAHYPSYNLIEHLVFPHLTRACKGISLETVDIAKHYMEKAETTKGLKIAVRIMDKIFKTGHKYAKKFKENLSIKFDKTLPTWNYTAVPNSS